VSIASRNVPTEHVLAEEPHCPFKGLGVLTASALKVTTNEPCDAHPPLTLPILEPPDVNMEDSA
jgi:hypothetical protein